MNLILLHGGIPTWLSFILIGIWVLFGLALIGCIFLIGIHLVQNRKNFKKQWQKMLFLFLIMNALIALALNFVFEVI